MIVIDSSIALQWVLPGAASEMADAYLVQGRLAAPDMLLVESANVLAKKARAGSLTGQAAQEALGIVRASIAQLVPSEPLVPRALALSIELSHPVYDCVFLACAEQLGVKLATRDAPFARRVLERGMGDFLEVMSS